jgi:polysaccharide deacetylase family protein (PEP-CTERM system associated)
MDSGSSQVEERAASVDARDGGVALPRVRHHFTVDVEEYFQVSAMEPYVERRNWEGIVPRIDVGQRIILDMLGERDARGTFFVLGWIAHRHPHIVRAIADAGHEVASHGWGHERVTTLTPDQFRTSIRDSKRALEDLTGKPVLGYRAPSFSIVRGSEWAFDMLLEEGYRYDSSLFPVRRAGYGYLGGGRDPYEIQRPTGTLAEVPPATIRCAKALLPAAGGAYLRLFPYALVRAGLRSAERRGVPGTFYIHPWELDPDQPRLPVNMKTRIRHYGGLNRTAPRIRRMLREFAFQPIVDTLSFDAVAAIG